ncbi:MAG: DNA alkylation repair protein [Myxococcota bacterium]
MPEPFKNLLGPDQVKSLARAFSKAWPAFPTRRFVDAATKGLAPLELKDRARHIARALEAALPTPRRKAMDVFVRALGPRLTVTEDFGTGIFAGFALSAWLEAHGLEDVQAALRANYELTQRFTAEFSIRPLLEGATAPTLAALRRWVKDDSPHVRRLVSEGTRPRLPWGPRLTAFARDPAPVFELLEALKDDPSEYVRRSVANNLNDHAKDHPALVLSTARRWLSGASKERRRLVEHGLRTLVKQGHPDALALLGAADGKSLEVRGRVTPPRVRLGERVTISARVTNSGREEAHVVVDAKVHFVTKRGGASVKTFRIGRVDAAPGQTVQLQRKLTLVHHSIRTLYPGRHRVEVQVNGRLTRAGAFVLA